MFTFSHIYLRIKRPASENTGKKPAPLEGETAARVKKNPDDLGESRLVASGKHGGFDAHLRTDLIKAKTRCLDIGGFCILPTSSIVRPLAANKINLLARLILAAFSAF